jgi:hypothetical protein
VILPFLKEMHVNGRHGMSRKGMSMKAWNVKARHGNAMQGLSCMHNNHRAIVHANLACTTANSRVFVHAKLACTAAFNNNLRIWISLSRAKVFILNITHQGTHVHLLELLGKGECDVI